MKNKLIIFLFITTSLFAQKIVEPKTVKVSDQNLIEYQLHKLQKDINKQFNIDIKNGKEPPYFYIKPNKKNVKIEKDRAIVNCEIHHGSSNKNKLKKQQQLVFIKDGNWKLDSYPKILEETIVKIRKPKVKKTEKIKPTLNKLDGSVPNGIASGGTIDIQLSDDVFIPYPICDDGNGNDIYEIDFELTEDAFDIQMFSAGANVDGCVYYESYVSDDDYDRVLFFVDPDWRRIIYSRESNGEYQAIDGFRGDDNVTFERPVAIDINEDGELFVLDAEARVVYKLQYNPSTHKITSTSQTIIIDSDHLDNPSDLSYGNDAYYNDNTNDYIAISDLGKKSIMFFDYNGNLLNEYTSYGGINITEPKRLVCFSPYLTYKKIAFIDGQRIVYAYVHEDNTLHSGYDSPLPNSSIPTDIGVSKNPYDDYGNYGTNIIVTDRTQNMIHNFTSNAQYICSFKGSTPQYMISPLSVFKNEFVSSGIDDIVKLDLYTMDMWSAVRGIKKFVPGADIMNIEVTRETFKWSLTYDETNLQHTEIELRDAYNDIITENSQYAYDYQLIPGMQYVWHIRYKPFHDDWYEGHEVGWKYKNISFTHTPTMPSIISEDYTIIYPYTASTNVQINGSSTLTCSPGSGITFSNNKRLIVYGTLNVNGASNNKVTFDFGTKGYPSGIWFYQYSNGMIDNAIVKNSYYGVKLDKAEPTIKNTEIYDCKYGILFAYLNSVSADPQILSNKIHDNDYYGLYFYRSGGKVRGNKIYNNSRGVYARYYSSPKFGHNNYLGHNHIYNNSYGFYAYISSSPDFGRNGCTSQGGSNKIENNSYKNGYANYNCEVFAENNWWGSLPPNTSKITAVSNSTIHYDPWLWYIPFSNMVTNNNSPEEKSFNARFNTNSDNLAKETRDGSKKYNYNPKWPIYWKLLYVRNLIVVEDYKFARDICMKVIDEHPDSSLSFWALDLLWQATQEKEQDDFTKYLEGKTLSKDKKELYGDMELILANYETSRSTKVSSFDATGNKYADTRVEESSLFQKFMYYFNDEEDEKTARSISDDLDKKYPKSESAREAHRLLGDEVKETYKELESKNSLNKTTKLLPEKYELLGNYPNPFNPSTTIKYALPFNSNVELTIYNLSGQEIMSFITSSQSSGYNNVVWNGTNNNGLQVTSGVYIYKFKAISLEGNGEVFEKSSKLMLLK